MAVPNAPVIVSPYNGEAFVNYRKPNKFSKKDYVQAVTPAVSSVSVLSTNNEQDESGGVATFLNHAYLLSSGTGTQATMASTTNAGAVSVVNWDGVSLSPTSTLYVQKVELSMRSMGAWPANSPPGE